MQDKVVLQYRRLVGQVVNCITIQHCIVRQWAGEKAVSRYNYCIVTEAKGGAGRWLGRRWARKALEEQPGRHAWGRGRALQAAGHAGGGRSWRAGVRNRLRQAGHMCGARAGHARGARGRQERGLALGCALGALGLFSIRFDSVSFLSRFLDIIREPDS